MLIYKAFFNFQFLLALLTVPCSVQGWIQDFEWVVSTRGPTPARGVRGHAPPRKFEIWSSLKAISCIFRKFNCPQKTKKACNQKGKKHLFFLKVLQETLWSTNIPPLATVQTSVYSVFRKAKSSPRLFTLENITSQSGKSRCGGKKTNQVLVFLITKEKQAQLMI